MSFPPTILAITIPRTGDFEVIEQTTIAFPEQKSNEIVVKIAYGGVNTIDTYFRKGIYPVKSFPQVLGEEASGVIVALPTNENVLNDDWYKLRDYKIGGKVSVRSLLALTVVTAMTESYDFKKDDIIFVHIVAGGLGLLFTAYAKSRGAIVIGTTSSSEKAELARSYGADHVILYTCEDTVQRVLKITNGEGVHAVFDGVGKDTFLSDFDILRRKGTLVAIGNASGPPDPISPLKLSAKNLKLVRPRVDNYIVTPEETHHYSKEAFDVYPFTAEGVQGVQRELTTPAGKLAGKILIKIADS
ncbi:hypothetical protein PHLCEN_2v1365 [Hermanssonia centrifuga]|uniref:Enoyl reductase (ER) domain-containing protein n=1 Tax=Hermanssonia centrifuga TaxID=98765 RepID=A0A2R6S3G8_9APHY|nr:hypothetical protein PHLCEN_2v1365 [Hermanssonia centrifuga]